MKYSFVVIAYNEEHNIQRCLDSILVQEGLGSSYEIVVVDDCSADKTPQKVKRMQSKNKKIKLIRNKQNGGRGYSRHAGVSAVSGDYIAMIDGDIILPAEWLKTCMEQIQDYDAVSGVPVPDGDVAFIFNTFGLKPKVVATSAPITGSNGLYRSGIFKNLNFDPALRNGEDIEFNHQLEAAGYRTCPIVSLVVEHNEKISFRQSMLWLYQSGIGATAQLKKYRIVRLPDLAFSGFIAVAAISVIIYVSFNVKVYALFLPALLYLLASSAMHIHSKFQFTKKPLLSTVAILVNLNLLMAYYAGRLVGIIT
ncbi:MAG TPA: glycosyltransferase [Candidatus Saccharimonadales bacterium]|nr:glycosyltransferase [Candidatus Saccharimonadales bacterium]